MTVDALSGGFREFSALVSGVITCTFYAPEVMIAVFLRVAVPLAPFALYYLFLYKRWFELNCGVHQPVDVVDFFVIFFFCDSMSNVADVGYLLAKSLKFEL